MDFDTLLKFIKELSCHFVSVLVMRALHVYPQEHHLLCLLTAMHMFDIIKMMIYHCMEQLHLAKYEELTDSALTPATRI